MAGSIAPPDTKNHVARTDVVDAIEMNEPDKRVFINEVDDNKYGSIGTLNTHSICVDRSLADDAIDQIVLDFASNVMSDASAAPNRLFEGCDVWRPRLS